MAYWLGGAVADDRGDTSGWSLSEVRPGRDAFVAGRDVVFQEMHERIARSAYIEQVRRIAPPEPPGLRDRELELAALARFCLAPGGGSYMWWQAGPWAGKSALLSTFVLRPPAEVARQVQIVSFFVTARLAAQDTREAFTEVLMEQLATLLGRSVPPALSEATREAHLLGQLSEAVRACAGEGRRLVLVVDGLDEDRGVTTGPDAHSIAALLPGDLSAGMRVIVAGRPNPPIPDDVPDWHPLRDPGIIRPLHPSRHAGDFQRLGEQELKRLLRGSSVERDLVGTLAAARGALSAAELSELISVPLWEIEEILHTVAGRTFMRRVGLREPGATRELYMLGHEELQTAATRYLGNRLGAYRDRLHEWAAAYSRRKWPPDTPQYLLDGYYQLLASLDDLPGMVACARDRARHDRMLDISGGDAAALAEVRVALDRIATQDDPDPATALCLACHRDQLAGRNSSIPIALPAVWAALGLFARAEALAASKADPQERAIALTQIAKILADKGRIQDAISVAGKAEKAAHEIEFTHAQANSLQQIAEALAQARQFGQAKALALSIPVPECRFGALVDVAQALAGNGENEQVAALAKQAEPLIPSIPWLINQMNAYARLTGVLAETGEVQIAETLARHAESLAHSNTDPYQQPGVSARIAEMLALARRYEEAEALARSISEPVSQAYALAAIAAALAEVGEGQQAEAMATDAATLACSAGSPEKPTSDPMLAEDVAEVADKLAHAGHFLSAVQVAGHAEALAHSLEDPQLAFNKAGTLVLVTLVLAKAEQYQQAETVARAIDDAERSAVALAAVSRILAAAGRYEEAKALAAQAETVARSIARYWPWDALEQLAAALAEAGQYSQAETLARSAASPYNHAVALARVSGTCGVAGRYEQATTLADLAEAVIQSITDPGQQAAVLVELAAALISARQHQRARAMIELADTLARTLDSPYLQWEIVAPAAGLLARMGLHEQAKALAHTIPDQDMCCHALVGVAAAQVVTLIQTGQVEQAETLADQAELLAGSIDNENFQDNARAEVSGVLAKMGRYSRSQELAGTIRRWDFRDDALHRISEALAEAGRYGQAEATARSITDRQIRARGLARVAKTLAAAGDRRSACGIAAAICAYAEWTCSVGLVLQLDPSAYAPLSEVLDIR